MLNNSTTYRIRHIKSRRGTLAKDVRDSIYRRFGLGEATGREIYAHVDSNFYGDRLAAARRCVRELYARGALVPRAVAPASSEPAAEKPAAAYWTPTPEPAEKAPEPTPEGKPIAETISELLGADFNVLLTGPTGCGKTTVAMEAAKRLGVDCYVVPCSAGMSEHHLLGRLMPTEDSGWRFTPAPFSKAWAEGGLVVLDEIDAADANVLLVLNSALANGRLVDGEGKTVMRHEHCYIMATANTAGGGATETYAGRSHLDASTVDRFSGAILEMDYCPTYEGKNVDADVLRFVRAVRHYIEAESLPYACSTRFALAATKRRAIGHGGSDIEASYFATWHKDDVDGLRATGSPRIA